MVLFFWTVFICIKTPLYFLFKNIIIPTISKMINNNLEVNLEAYYDSGLIGINNTPKYGMILQKNDK